MGAAPSERDHHRDADRVGSGHGHGSRRRSGATRGAHEAGAQARIGRGDAPVTAHDEELGRRSAETAPVDPREGRRLAPPVGHGAARAAVQHLIGCGVGWAADRVADVTETRLASTISFGYEVFGPVEVWSQSCSLDNVVTPAIASWVTRTRTIL